MMREHLDHFWSSTKGDQHEFNELKPKIADIVRVQEKTYGSTGRSQKTNC